MSVVQMAAWLLPYLGKVVLGYLHGSLHYSDHLPQLLLLSLTLLAQTRNWNPGIFHSFCSPGSATYGKPMYHGKSNDILQLTESLLLEKERSSKVRMAENIIFVQQ